MNSKPSPRPIVAPAGVMLALLAMSGCAQTTQHAGPTLAPVIYPLPPAPARVAYLTSIDGDAIMGHRSNRLERFLFGHDSEPPKTITKPFGLAAGQQTLLVCDTQQNVVHVLDFKTQRFDTIGSSGRGRLTKPVAVAIDEQANRYVADTGRGQVVVFSPDNQPIRALGPSTAEEFKPVALALHQGKLYVLNAARHRVEILDPESGELLQAFGEKGTGPGQMLFPSGLAVDSAGRTHVADLLNCRVQVFAEDGSLLRSFGKAGDRAGEFSRPKHLAVAPDGLIYVVDAAFQRVQMFDHQGRVLLLFGGPGSDPGCMTLPAGICIDRTLLPYFSDWLPAGFEADYLVFVSDQFSPRKIGVFAFGRMRADTESQTSTEN